MIFNFDILDDCFFSGIKYIPTTLLLAVVPLAIGIIFGTIIALIRVYHVPVLDKFFAVFITIYQGVPAIVALMIYNLIFIYTFDDFCAALHLPFTIRDVNSIWIGILGLTLMQTTYISEIIRGALLSIDKGQTEAAYSVGLTKLQTIRRIIIPQMIPVAFPGMTNMVIGGIKATVLVVAVGGTEIMNGTLIPATLVYANLEGYIVAAGIYWALTAVIETLMHRAELHVGKFRKTI